MASPLHIQFRIAGEYNNSEPPVRGEPRFDPDKVRFGIFNQGTSINWYPQLDSVNNRLNLNSNQILSGMTSTDSQNDIALDFSQANELRIVLKSTNQVLASFSPEGSLINSQTISGVTRIPFINLLANYSLIDKRTIANDIPISTNNGSFVAAPNWYIWKSSNVNSVGSMALTWDLPLVSGASASAKLVVSGSPNASGVRHFVNCENLGEETCTFSAYYKAPLGQMAVIRVTSDTGSVATKTITATGEIQREFLTFTISAGATLLYIDSLYTPSYTDININTWHVCSPILNQGSGAISIEKRNKPFERILTDEFYVKAGYKSEAVVNLFYKQLTGNSVYVNLPESNSVVSSNTTSARLNVTTPDNQNKIYEVYSYFSTSETV